MNLKSTFAALAFTVIGGSAALADHRVGFGGHFSNHCNGDVTLVQCMILGRHDDDRWDRLHFISCADGQRILSRRGYTKIKTVSCKGSLYIYKARWKGKTYELKVARNTGDLRSARKI
jgi:hypothetical protein